ncbi:MAG: amidohydrolase family protein [Thermogutta sp.]|nr:amidohydrolase family protein [Thermogutta sp.]
MTTRRRFLRTGLAAAVTTCLGPYRKGLPANSPTAESSPEDDIPIVDTHQHLWDLGKVRLAWLEGTPALNRNFLPSDYLEAVQGLPVRKAVYMEVAVVEEDLVREAEYVIDLCRRGDGPTAAAVIGGRPAAPGFAEYVDRFRGNPYVKGVRYNPPGTPAGREMFFSPAFSRGLALLGERGWSFDICVPPDWLEESAEIVARCPATRFIVDHCGNADPNRFREAREGTAGAAADCKKWRAGMEALAAHRRVVCKISGLISRMTPGRWTADDLAPVVNACIDIFGEDRVMFAGDWPVCTKGGTLRDWIRALQTIVAGRPAAFRRKLFAENAVRFYGLR